MNKTVDQLSQEALELLRELIAIPSFSSEEGGTATVIEWWFSSHGIPYKRVKNSLCFWHKFKAPYYQI